MKVLSSLLAVLLLAAPSLAGDLPDLKRTGVLRLLMGKVPGRGASADLGFDEEILDGFAQFQQLRLERVLKDNWDELIPALLEGQGDVIGGDFESTEARRRQAAFTVEVFPVRNVIVSRKPHRTIQSLEQLRAERVVTVKGTSLAEILAGAGIPPSSLFFAERRAVTAGLRDGTYGATLLPLTSAILARRGDPELQVGMALGSAGSNAFALRPGDKALLAALNEYVGNLRRGGSWNRLVVKHFGESALEILHRARD